MSLYPTKTRLALLQAVGGDDVFERGGDYFQATSWTGPDRKVTERALEQLRAGWVEMVQRTTTYPERGRKDTVVEAAAICQTCPVLDACADYADSLGEQYGVWGGMTLEQRRARAWRKEVGL